VESLIAARGEIVVVLSGIDEALTQRVHARHSYLPHEIIWNRRFADIFVAQDDGSLALEFDRFHAFED
jgi:inward rectifier potassium channel